MLFINKFIYLHHQTKQSNNKVKVEAMKTEEQLKAIAEAIMMNDVDIKESYKIYKLFGLYKEEIEFVESQFERLTLKLKW